MTTLLVIVGSCDTRLFGLTAAERLRRQRGALPGPALVADASTVLNDAAVHWLLENPGKVLTTPTGRPAAVALPECCCAVRGEAALNERAHPRLNPADMPCVFVRKLRRRDKLLVRSLDEQPRAEVEKGIFGSVYKGVTDVVTKHVWPLPALWATRMFAALRIPPNAVTVVGIVSMALAAFLWASGELALGLLFAWLMTFLDTVDGKLARVTVTSSRLGNKLDHITDLVHPPVWWACLAFGLAAQSGAAMQQRLLEAFLVILTCYTIGRAVEILFKKTVGYNAYLWRRFDSAFRLVVARRNTILLIITLGLLLGVPAQAYVVAAVWSLISVGIQLVRFFQALQASRRGHARSWLM